MKKIGLFLLISILAMGLVLLSGGTALANFGPHGGYGEWSDAIADGGNDDGVMQADEVDPDDDACAGCHRAHTSISDVTWTDTEGGVANALLLGAPSTTLMAFCYTCHSDAGSGAATNVEGGVYDNSTGRVGAPFLAKVGYGTPTESEYLGVLNGGGFSALGGTSTEMSSIHSVDGATGVAWGESRNLNNGGTNMIMDCVACHDPHGSSNYRILKDEVNGVKVGGYLNEGSFDPAPDPWVIANEVGYPAGPGVANPGFGLHRNYSYADQNPTATAYAPDYTEARYAQPVGLDSDKGMSGWCASCHTYYNTVSSSGGDPYRSSADGLNAVRHRHPINVPLTAYLGYRALLIDEVNDLNTPYGDDVDIPLEHDVFSESRGTGQRNQLEDYIGCLTCHRAHGTNTSMSGYANAISNWDPQPDSGGVTPTSQGVQPTMDSALLRADNRGVCERCHNK